MAGFWPSAGYHQPIPVYLSQGSHWVSSRRVQQWILFNPTYLQILSWKAAVKSYILCEQLDWRDHCGGRVVVQSCFQMVCFRARKGCHLPMPVRQQWRPWAHSSEEDDAQLKDHWGACLARDLRQFWWRSVAIGCRILAALWQGTSWVIYASSILN